MPEPALNTPWFRIKEAMRPTSVPLMPAMGGTYFAAIPMKAMTTVARAASLDGPLATKIRNSASAPMTSIKKNVLIIKNVRIVLFGSNRVLKLLTFATWRFRRCDASGSLLQIPVENLWPPR